MSDKLDEIRLDEKLAQVGLVAFGIGARPIAIDRREPASVTPQPIVTDEAHLDDPMETASAPPDALEVDLDLLPKLEAPPTTEPLPALTPHTGWPRLVKATQPAEPIPEDRLTEAGTAERFARLLGNELRFDHRRGCWLIWDRHHWARDADAAVTRLAIDFAREWQREALDISDRDQRERVFKAAIRLERRDALHSMLALARDLKPIADTGEGWDADPWLLGTPNGVVDLQSGQLRDGRREDRIALKTSVEYQPDAYSDLWNHTLHTILIAKELVDFFHRAIGYSATGDMRLDRWFLGHGSGRNGKGTLYHPIRRALGDYSLELPAAIFDHRHSGAPYDLAKLPGKRFVTSSESGDTIRLNHDRIKQLTGGDPMTAANKYEKSFEFNPVCKLWLACNKMPRVTDDSPAFWARVYILPFTVSFVGREDPAIREALQHDPAHQAAVLDWIVRGAVLYHENGLGPTPTQVQAATEQYRQDSDHLHEFLAESCEPVPEADLTAGELFDHYVAWAKEQRLTERERLSATAFGRRMSTRFSWRRINGVKHYQGIARRTS